MFEILEHLNTTISTCSISERLRFPCKLTAKALGPDLRHEPRIGRSPSPVQPWRFLSRASDVLRVAASTLMDALWRQLQHTIEQCRQESAIM